MFMVTACAFRARAALNSERWDRCATGAATLQAEIAELSQDSASLLCRPGADYSALRYQLIQYRSVVRMYVQ